MEKILNTRTALMEYAETHTTLQGGHGTGKTGNLAVNFSRQGKHREFSKFIFLHRENGANTENFEFFENFVIKVATR